MDSTRKFKRTILNNNKMITEETIKGIKIIRNRNITKGKESYIRKDRIKDTIIMLNVIRKYSNKNMYSEGSSNNIKILFIEIN
jgi:hypothetical protein